MDALTNIYNRYGFDTLAERMIAKNPRNHYIAALLDVDNFKLINDVYGHAYGDRTLKNLADSMKKFFPSDIIKYLRNIKLKRECYRPHASMSD